MADPSVDAEPVAEPDTPLSASGRERVGGTGGVGSHHQTRPIRIPGTGSGVGGEALQGQVQQLNVIRCGVRAGVALPDDPGQRLTRSDLGPVQVADQRVEPERLLPRWCRQLLL